LRGIPLTTEEINQVHVICQQIEAEPDREKFLELVDRLIVVLEHNQVDLARRLQSARQ
jgi:hypothetical protein